MGMLERMRDPRADGIAPSLRSVAPRPVLPPEASGRQAGVSSTNFRNCELFMVLVANFVELGLEAGIFEGDVG